MSGLVKICGMREPANIREIAALRPDYLGFIFWEGSPRYAGDLDISSLSALHDTTTPVALFVNADEETIAETCSRFGISTIQLHGNETPRFCQRMRSQGLRVMKALPVSEAADLDAASQYEGHVDMFVFDSRSKGYGGSGRKFDWQLLASYRGSTPYLLSGGISPDDADSISTLQLPGMAGIDLNSRFETTPGVKSPALLATFLSKIREQKQQHTI